MADEPLNKIQKIDCSGSIFEKTTLFGDEQLFTFHRDYISDARRVIWLKQNDEIAFHPTFTHQLFEKDKIRGYKNLRIDLYFAQDSLITFLGVSYESVLPDPDKVDDIKAKIGKYLRNGFYSEKSEFLEAIKQSKISGFTPLGKLIRSYRRLNPLPETMTPFSKAQKDNFERSYEIYKTPNFRPMHDRMQFFLILFIDASSFIDPTDSIWTVLCLFEKLAAPKKRPKYVFIGYCTLYSFFCFPDSSRLRISQILVLPPYQKSGHGGQFMEAIYETAQRKDYAELNVEDPSDGFQFLRDLKDLSLCHREGFFDFLCDRNFAEPLSGPLRRSIKAKLKITDTQIERCFEIFKLKHLDMNNSEQYKTYRLIVKKRLFQIFAEDLAALENEEIKARLSDLYFDVEKRNSALLLKLLQPPTHIFEILYS